MMPTMLEKLIFIHEAAAQWTVPFAPPRVPGGLPNPLKYGTIEEVLRGVWGYLFTISIPLVAIMVIIGAFQIMFAAGNVEKVETGKKTVLYAVIGFVIILLAGGIVSIIAELVGANCVPRDFVGPLPQGTFYCN